MNQHILGKLQTSFSASCRKNQFVKWGILAGMNLTDANLELCFPHMQACIDYFFPRAKLPLLNVPGWLTNQLNDLHVLFREQHSHHNDQIPCKNLLCAARSSLQKFHAQSNVKQGLAFDSTNEFKMESLRKFVDCYDLWEASVCGLQDAVLINHSVEVRLECDNFVFAKSKQNVSVHNNEHTFN
jgi:hypothetical protein